jgi:glycosyltransferase involved in cell wall biosynthesis
MLRLMHNSRLRREFDLVQVSTCRDGSTAAKVLEAARGLAFLAWLCARGRVDLVHVHVSTKGSLARKSLAVAVARVARVPVVLHVHSGGFFYAQREPASLPRRIQDRTLRWVLGSSNMVIALTPAWERRLKARGPIRRSRVIPNAPDLTVPAKTRSSSPKHLVLFLGHLYRAKGVYDLLEAFAVINRERPSLRLVLAGEGPELRGLRSRAEQLGIDAVVDLPGWVGSTDKAELLATAACLVLPSHNEGLPLVLLEAMIAGVPVLATAVGGVPDVVEDRRDALLVPPNDVPALADALIAVLDDAQLAARLCNAAQRRALAEYTPDAMAQRVGAVYREMLTARSQASGAPH